ncbi:hypothetical protein HPB48_020917 [Haemaphysalis longicornis]|uniref:WD repeat-containing protein 55 homolog n=1 Tax=Haemaphysalis longicornis TaxID=44386 RepID=A0A9J6GWL4_HAELO|nr:hypothetical protein HPB48_020917 [Haemaphysalis longicornis]
MATIWQQVLAIDARYNAYRSPNDPNFRTLYIRRRSQLLRESQKNERCVTFRKQYLRLRSQLLAQRYGLAVEQSSNRSRSMGGRSNSRATLETSDSSENRLGGTGELSRRGSFGNQRSLLTNEGLVPTYCGRGEPVGALLLLPQHCTKWKKDGGERKKKHHSLGAIVGGTSISENYAFAGVHHIFDQHRDAVTSVRFANNEKYLLGCCSADGNLSICRLDPPCVLYLLKGHRAKVSGFEWSLSNDLLVSGSLDGTVRLWDAKTGACVRTVPDPAGASIYSCVFQPANNNMVVTGNEKGLVQVLNISTGIYLKGGSSTTTGCVLCLTFEPTGKLLWAGDDRGYIVSYLFDLPTGKLTKGKRMMVAENCPITCLSARQWASREARDPSVLVNCGLINALILYSLLLKRKFHVKHRCRTPVRSSFCPDHVLPTGGLHWCGKFGVSNTSLEHKSLATVTGSEDQCVNFFDVERAKPLLNKLQGHSAAVLDVCFNYDESLLASSDALGMVILWKRSSA